MSSNATAWTSDRLDPRTGRERKRHIRGLFHRYGGKAWGYKKHGKMCTGFASREDAILAMNEATNYAITGAPPPVRSKLTLSDLAVEVLAAKHRTHRPASVAADELGWRWLKPVIGHVRPAAVTAMKLEEIRADLESGKITGTALKPASADRHMLIVRELLSEAQRRRLIEVNPFSSMRRRRGVEKAKRSYPTLEDVEALLTAAEARDARSEARAKYAPLIATLAFSGCRVGEALALRWQNVNLLGGTIAIEESLLKDGSLGPTKTSAGRRVIQIPPRLVDVLAQAKPLTAEDDHFVFASARDSYRPMTYRNALGRGWVPILKTAGLAESGYTPHSLRHTLVSHLIGSGHALTAVAAHAGHANVGITGRVYAHELAAVPQIDLGTFGASRSEEVAA